MIKKLAPPPFIPLKAYIGLPFRAIAGLWGLLWYGTIGCANWLWMIITNPMLNEVNSSGGSREIPQYEQAFRQISQGWTWVKYGLGEYEFTKLERRWQHEVAVVSARLGNKE